MNTKYILLTITISLCIPFTGAQSYAQESPVNLLIGYIDNDHYPNFHNTLNEISLNIHSDNSEAPGFSEFLIDLWEGRRDKHPGLAWDTVNNIYYRSSVAGVMSQGTYFGWFEYDKMDAVYSFLRQQLEHLDAATSLDVSTTAIVYLGLARREVDIPLFADLAESNDTGVWRSAISALGKMCAARAGEVLADLENKTSEGEKKSFVQETLQKFHAPYSESFRCRDP